jgi:O-antigen/teichoic acid export membrane protein
MITAFVQYVNISYSTPLVAWKKEKNVLYSTIMGGVVNTVLNIILIPNNGAVGAATATIFSELAVFVGLSYSMYKTLQNLFLFNLLKITLISLSSCGFAYLLLKNGAGLFLSSLVCLVSFILINLLFKIVTIKEIRGFFAR